MKKELQEKLNRLVLCERCGVSIPTDTKSLGYSFLKGNSTNGLNFGKSIVRIEFEEKYCKECVDKIKEILDFNDY